MGFDVKFWGVRGSIACAGPNHVKYGGNTSCIEMRVGDHRIILDAGTGLRNAGQTFLKEKSGELFILLTHTHWDHINGFPFFVPAYNPDWKIHVKAGHLKDKGGIQAVLSAQMDNPMFPVPLEAMQAKITYEDFRAGESLDLYDDITVRTALLNHPNDATAYRIDYNGHSAVYVTDTEHVPGELDQNILEIIEGADLVIYDSTYTEEEWPAKVGWGHSTWNEGMRLCQAANVKRLAIFHHDPDHDDNFMDKLAEEAEKAWDANFVVREGTVYSLE
jgi:phosphoribosyl 1,2-cyclic phosphodiesterase